MNKTGAWMLVVGAVVIVGGIAYASLGHSKDTDATMMKESTEMSSSTDAMMRDDAMATSSGMMEDDAMKASDSDSMMVR